MVSAPARSPAAESPRPVSGRFALFALVSAALALGSNLVLWQPADARILAVECLLPILILVPALLLGLALVTRLELDPVARVVHGLAAGVGTLVLVVLVLGLVGGLYRAALLGLLAAAAACGLRRWRQRLAELRAAAVALGDETRSPLLATLATLLLAALAIPMIPGLLPVAFYDSLLYHLEAPALWLNAHRLIAIPYNFHLDYPLNMSVLYLLARAIDAQASPALLHLAFLAAAALGLVALGRPLGRGVGLTAAVLFVLMPSALESAAYPIADHMVVFFVLAATLTWCRWRATGLERYLALAGAELGLATGAKYTTLLVGVAPLVALTLFAARGEPGRRRWRPALIIVVTSVATFSPWLVRNGLATGNPVYPYFFAARPDFAPYHSFHSEVAQRLPDDAGLGAFLAHIAAGPRELLSTGAGVAPLVGLALFMALPFLALHRPLPRQVYELVLLAATGFALWDLSVHVTRYGLPFLALLAVPSAWALVSVPSTALRRSLVVLVAIALVQNLYLAALALDWGATSDLLRGRLTRDAYLERNVSYYAAARWASRHLDSSSRVLYLGEGRGYYCDVAHVTQGFTHPPLLITIAQKAKGQQLGQALRQRGYTHLLVSLPELRRIALDYGGELPGNDNPEAARAVKEFLLTGIERLRGNDDIFLARIK